VIDIGINLMSNQFDNDRDEVVARAIAAGVSGMILTGTSEESSTQALAYVRDFEHEAMSLWSTAGIHPHDAAAAEPGWQQRLAKLADNDQVRAIGETGLDFNRNYSPPEVQRACFADHINLAIDCQLPLFVHDRDTHGEVYAMLQASRHKLTGVVIHCFTGNRDDLVRYLDAGFYIGITGWVCDRKRGVALRELVPAIPTDRLLIETDAPYLLPGNAQSPTQAKRRNEPCLLAYVAATIADLTDVDSAEVAAITAANARRFFRLDG
jgi:TatD DNase family protein